MKQCVYREEKCDVTLPWSPNFWITTVGSLSNDDGDGNENGRTAECHCHLLLSLALGKDTRLLSIACFAAGLVARVPDGELDRAYIGDLDCLSHRLA